MNASRILVVEDTPDLLDLYSAFLQEEGYDVLSAENGQSCLRLVQEEKPDLVVLDVMLPDINGIDVCRQIKTDPKTERTFVVNISGRLTSGDCQAEGLEAGADSYLTKPFEKRTLVAHIQALLRIKEAEAEMHHRMERKMQQRTAELLAANAFLKQEISDREEAQSKYRRADETRKKLLQKLVITQEEERQRLSRELHDQIGQSLAALMIGLKALATSGEVAADGRESLEKLEKLTTQLAQDAHAIARNLRPTALDDLGLETALANYIEEWSDRSGVPVDFHCNGLLHQRLPPHIETALYRIVQEALTNVLKHAKPTRVSVIIENRGGRALAIVEDNGCGFDVNSVLDRPVREQRLGLLGMEERATLLGGSFTVESTPNVGTMIIVTIPLEG